MPHKFLVKDIALQAGVSVATVDRVINNRLPVRKPTRQRVEQAIAELERQESQIGRSGRKFIIDVVIEAPARFCRITETALTQQAPLMHPAIFRARYTTSPNISDSDLRATTKKIAKRGSDGVILVVRDTKGTREAIKTLSERNIPVVTLATDVPRSERIAYAGLDNRSAGATAGFLIGRTFRNKTGVVLVTTRNEKFASELDREISFNEAIRKNYPNVSVVALNEGPELTNQTEGNIAELFRDNPQINAVYSIGGNNRAILRGMKCAGRPVEIFVAHDLDEDNEALLRQGDIDFVLHQEMERAVRDACHAIMKFHKAKPKVGSAKRSHLQILTPHNL